MNFQPVIKWSGSKRSQSKDIVQKFPRKINAYYEPFVGGGSVLRALMDSDIEVEKYLCSDINSDLIHLWNTIKVSPDGLLADYEKLWNELNSDNDLNRKKKYFGDVRKRFNDLHQPSDFLFIMRTTTNGMPRYNNDGDFNNSFHITRSGIEPFRLEKIMKEWHILLNKNDVIFYPTSFEYVSSKEGDVLYLDPPYAGTKGMYYGCIDYELFWKWLRLQKGKYFLSFDGKVNEEDFTYEVPKDLYTEHTYLKSGNSPFRRVIGTSNKSYVLESLYNN